MVDVGTADDATDGPSWGLDTLAFDVDDKRRSKLEARLANAAEAYLAERFEEARKLLAPIAEEAPRAAAVRELLGLSLYRLGQFDAAASELSAFGEVSGSLEQFPVLADCYRALSRWDAMDRLCDALEEPGVAADLAIEGRIVRAGALADRELLGEAIDHLKSRKVLPARPADHHLRRAYALGDLYERVGEVPRARHYFSTIKTAAPDYLDVEERLDALT